MELLSIHQKTAHTKFNIACISKLAFPKPLLKHKMYSKTITKYIYIYNEEVVKIKFYMVNTACSKWVVEHVDGRPIWLNKPFDTSL